MDLIIAVSIALIIGVVFFISEYFSEGRCIKCRSGNFGAIYLSFIAGISVAYFFLELLPQITVEITDPWIEMVPFMLILIGFVFVHFSEKWILQRVELQTRDKIKGLRRIEEELEQEEDNIRDFIGAEIIKEDWENLGTLKRLAQIAADKHHKEVELKHQENDLKNKVVAHLQKDLDEIHIITNFLYHILIGLIIVNLLLTVNLVAAVLFFFFAYFKAEVSNVTSRHVELEGMVFHRGAGEKKWLKIILQASVLIGVVVGLLFELFYPIPPMVTFFLLAFVSGTILYLTVREVIPEKGKGRPLYFLLGVFVFSVVILSIYFLELSVL